MTDKPEIGTQWFHADEGYDVKIVDVGLVKDDNASSWRLAVSYVRFGEDESTEGQQTRTRSQEDFLEKFKPA